MTSYASLDDLTVLWRPMTPEEQQRASALLPVVSASLRQEAKKRGRDLEAMLEADEDLREVARRLKERKAYGDKV